MKTHLLLFAAVLCDNSFALHWDHEFSSMQLPLENVANLFQTWRFEHSKVYESIEEELHRFGNFQFNLQRIAASNDQYNAGEKKYRLRMNQFGDLTDEEFYASYNCPVVTKLVDERRQMLAADSGIGSLKKMAVATIKTEGATVDWNAAGYVSPVKTQGHCGSCWAFSAVASMECQYAILHNAKPPLQLSEQQLVDCTGPYGNYGCHGGWYFQAWKYAEETGGLCSASDYPYTSYSGYQGSCKATQCGTKHYAPSGSTFISHDSDDALQFAVNQGCVSVAIEANQFAFRFYSSGILDGECGAKIDHAVVVTGYGVLEGDEYWIVKNSWGKLWGAEGYAWLCKNCTKNGNEGECGINSYPYQVSMW